MCSMLKKYGAFLGNRNDPSAGVLCSPHRHRVPPGIAAGTPCVLTARARRSDAVCLHGGWHARATNARVATVVPPAASMHLRCVCLDFRVACVESSPAKLPFNRFAVEAPQQRRSGKIDWGLLDVFWGRICILQLEGECTKAVPNPKSTGAMRLMAPSF